MVDKKTIPTNMRHDCCCEIVHRTGCDSHTYDMYNTQTTEVPYTSITTAVSKLRLMYRNCTRGAIDACVVSCQRSEPTQNEFGIAAEVRMQDATQSVVVCVCCAQPDSKLLLLL